jgi:N-methylhydantoinase B/oxoprolinase/acetone carboxylase alpha subunit
VRLVTPGGGGYGDPAKRDPVAVAEDVREGYVSKAAAHKHYGYQEA